MYCFAFLVIAVGSSCSSENTSDGSPEEQIVEPIIVEPIVEESGEQTVEETVTVNTALTCDEIATKFVTRGSANVDLPDPEVSATCANDTVTVTANGIPDFPYIQTSPGVPEANTVDYNFPATPTVADVVTSIPVIGAIGVAINGIPIYGPTEGPGGDVLSRPGGFTECGGHNGPTGYHYHIFDVTGSDFCLFTEAEVTPAPQLFGYALDGYPIYSGNTQYTSSWFLSDASLFATDTWSAHTYAPESGDLDQCNGRTDEDGNYAYYTTEGFPYTLGCLRGVVELESVGGPRGSVN